MCVPRARRRRDRTAAARRPALPRPPLPHQPPCGPGAGVGVARRCACGAPGVVEAAPRLPDGTPFPTTYSLTCPRAAGAVSTLEGSGLMRSTTDRLADDAEL